MVGKQGSASVSGEKTYHGDNSLSRCYAASIRSPSFQAMSLRRVALRRHSDHQVAETAEEDSPWICY